MYIALDIEGVGTDAKVVAQVLERLPTRQPGLLVDAAPPYELCYSIGGTDVGLAHAQAAQSAIADLVAELVPVNGPGRMVIHTKAGREIAAQAALNRLIAAVS